MDKLVVERIFGLPYQRLFHLHLGPDKYEKQKRLFYKLILAVGLIDLVWFAAAGPRSWVVWILSGIFVILIILKLGYTLLHQPDIRNNFEVRPPDHPQRKFAKWGWKYIIKWWLRPLAWLFFDSWAKCLLALFKMCKPFYPEVQSSFMKKFRRKFNIEPEDAGTDLYWLTYSYLCQNNVKCANLTKQWLNLYGFSRNLAICFFMLFIYS